MCVFQCVGNNWVICCGAQSRQAANVDSRQSTGEQSVGCQWSAFKKNGTLTAFYSGGGYSHTYTRHLHAPNQTQKLAVSDLTGATTMWKAFKKISCFIKELKCFTGLAAAPTYVWHVNIGSERSTLKHSKFHCCCCWVLCCAFWRHLRRLRLLCALLMLTRHYWLVRRLCHFAAITKL